ncbi:hypothetical protein Tco_0355137 [Tanacetum coccineum]
MTFVSFLYISCAVDLEVTRPGSLFRCDPFWRCYRDDVLLDVNENDSIEPKSGKGCAILKKERVDESEKIIEKERNRLEVKRPFEVRKEVYEKVWPDVREIQSHDEVYDCLKGGSENSRGRGLAISMVEEA